MSLPEIKYCPGTLSEGFNTYSRTCLNRLFNGRKVSHILPYTADQVGEQEATLFLENRIHISISGVQEKLSLVLDKNKLRLTHPGEQGTYLLKPIPRDLKNTNQVPANEHLTMQIARQIYGIPTAENALIFFKDGAQAYITKRFDIKPDGSKWGVEDFATLAGKTAENAGPDFKYSYSYEGIATLLSRFVPAYMVEIEKFFKLVLFNYLFSNGDAHLKNFSLLESAGGDYVFSPAYDLINTRLHINDSDFALDQGLFSDDVSSRNVRRSGHPTLEDFDEFARRLHIPENRRQKLWSPFIALQPGVETLIQKSFLDEKSKRAYLLHYQTKRNYL